MTSAGDVYEISRAVLGDQSGYIAVLKVFMDESGIHDNSPVITVGALLGLDTTWSDWSKKWSAKKPPIKVFHSTDCANLRGEFDGWSLEDKNDYVKNLLPIIGECNLAQFVVGVRLNDYREIAGKYPVLDDVIGLTPHTACFQWVMHTILDMMDAHNDPQRVAFFHEVNSIQGEVGECFQWIKQFYPHRPMTLAFGEKTDYLPLEAADVLAYEGNRRLRDLDARDRKAWKSINPGGNKRSLKYFDKPSLLGWARSYLSASDLSKE